MNDIEIKKSNRRKTFAIKISRNAKITVFAPHKISDNKIKEMIESKSDWILKKIDYIKNNNIYCIKPKEYHNGEVFYYMGVPRVLRIEPSIVNSIEIGNNDIVVNINKRSNAENILKKCLINNAKNLFHERLLYNFEIFSRYHKFKIPSLKIRKMKSRWGSMSNKGEMTLNLNLIHTPLMCIDYVIMHELCHLKYKNHDKKFYDLQEKFVPNYKQLKMELRRYCE
jgi:predicted metal-dependent hydrolase